MDQKPTANFPKASIKPEDSRTRSIHTGVHPHGGRTRNIYKFLNIVIDRGHLNTPGSEVSCGPPTPARLRSCLSSLARPRFGNFSLWLFSLLIYYISVCLFILSPSPGHQPPEGGDHLSWPPPSPPRHRARLTAAATRCVDWPHGHWPLVTSTAQPRGCGTWKHLPPRAWTCGESQSAHRE